jgi:riboflavin biosynthesis pyrimidine reductase
VSQTLEQELSALYGAQPLNTRGTVHVVHAARGPGGVLHALRVGSPGAPHSATDFFVLNLCRARADAVLTSAENLRREPTLTHDLQGPWAAALKEYRSQALSKSAPLTCAILTRTGELPAQHPFWHDGTRKLVLCPAQLTQDVSRRVGARAQVVGLDGLSARTACAWLHGNGHALVSVEAGPSTASTLYEAPSQVDELLLTSWETASAEAELAGPLPDDPSLFAQLRPTSCCTRDEAGETFRFERWARP